jgi:hypothetical protein
MIQRIHPVSGGARYNIENGLENPIKYSGPYLMYNFLWQNVIYVGGYFPDVNG